MTKVARMAEIDSWKNGSKCGEPVLFTEPGPGPPERCKICANVAQECHQLFAALQYSLMDLIVAVGNIKPFVGHPIWKEIISTTKSITIQFPMIGILYLFSD